jgi:hypothetical protein
MNASNACYAGKTAKEIQELSAQLRALKVEGPIMETRKRKEFNDCSSPIAVAKYLSESLKVNKEQREIFDFYANFLLNPDDPKARPPDIVLVHGIAGCGKSRVAEAIDDLNAYLNKNNIKTSFNAINALAIGGQTTAALIQLRPELHAEDLVPMTQDQLQKFKDLSGLDENTTLIMLEEVSNYAPFHLARLSMTCQQAMQCYDKPYGGLPCIMLGDLNQLGPVKAGPCLTDAVIDYYRHEAEVRQAKEREAEDKRQRTA